MTKISSTNTINIELPQIVRFSFGIMAKRASLDADLNRTYQKLIGDEDGGPTWRALPFQIFPGQVSLDCVGIKLVMC